LSQQSEQIQMSNVGIDVAKLHLDIAVRPTGERFRVDNNEGGFAELVRRLGKVHPRRIVLEPSGGYELAVVQHLAKETLPVVVVNARQIRRFGQATGRLATD
jgi:transposase